MKTVITEKIKLRPNDKQVIYFKRACGSSRFAYNWALEQNIKQYNEYKEDESFPKPTWVSLGRDLTLLKKEGEYKWMREIASEVTRQPIRDLDRALKNFFSGRAKFPKFRKRGCRDSFYVHNACLRVENKRVLIPKIGWVKCSRNMRFEGKILKGTVTRKADWWYISISIEIDDYPTKATSHQGKVGVDLGIKKFAMLSNGMAFDNPTPSKQRLKQLQRALAKQEKGSKRRAKTLQKIQRIHARMANSREWHCHQLSSHLVRNHPTIAIEDLHVKDMMKNRHLARAIGEMGWRIARAQLEQKSGFYGNEIIVVPRFYPSSKTCSACGHIHKELKLKDRVFKCPICGYTIDRDLNAAINLEQYPSLQIH